MALEHPNFDPVALQLGPLAIRWYGLMYILAFLLFIFLGRRRAKQTPGWSAKDVDDLLLYGVFGVILGGRLGYVLFYKPFYYAANPLEIFSVWLGGMSFHGGFLGVLAAIWIYAWRTQRSWLQVTDFVAPLCPLGLAAGRLGNFINGELWGRVSDVPWAMIFPQAGDRLARHPSQLYHVALEGILLFIILWIYSSKPRARGAVSGAFLLGYGIFRFISELFREPDSYLGFLALGWTMGQWLSVPMIVAGIVLLWWAYRANRVAGNPSR